MTRAASFLPNLQGASAFEFFGQAEQFEDILIGVIHHVIDAGIHHVIDVSGNSIQAPLNGD